MHPAHGSGQVLAQNCARLAGDRAGGFPDAGNYRHPKGGAAPIYLKSHTGASPRPPAPGLGIGWGQHPAQVIEVSL